MQNLIQPILNAQSRYTFKVAPISGEKNSIIIARTLTPRIRLWLNNTLTVDYTEKDDQIERTGVIGLQIHGGAKAKVYHKDIIIEELTPKTEK